ncbi:MAG: TlyA family rRNA (cytidine-2'-O)-methyltransferase, partial [Syntrophales bacterium]|nr:TlyA family rRNA (cytidine-2'-O)-methyltransferase [Syntrophales bacterium]
PVIFSVIRGGGIIIALIKPQFEEGRHDIGKGGVVKDSGVQERVVNEIMDCARQIGFLVQGCCESPIKGPAGNREFFLHGRKP